MFEQMRSRQVPFVLIDRPIEGVRASFVGVDNEAVGRLATEHLIAKGCRKIAHLRGPKIGLATKRWKGCADTLKKNKLSVPAGFVVDAGFQDKTGYWTMKKLLESSPRPDGVFCYNDPVAIGATKALLEAGLRVPEDVAVVGAGNVHYSDALAVPLSTIDQKTREIGRERRSCYWSRLGRKGRRGRRRFCWCRKLWCGGVRSGSCLPFSRFVLP